MPFLEATFTTDRVEVNGARPAAKTLELRLYQIERETEVCISDLAYEELLEVEDQRSQQILHE